MPEAVKKAKGNVLGCKSTSVAGAVLGGLIAVQPLIESGSLDMGRLVVGFLVGFLGIFSKIK